MANKKYERKGGSGAAKPSIVGGKQIKVLKGKVAPHPHVQWMCGVKPQIICVADAHTGLLLAINTNRNELKKKICAGEEMTAGQYYDLKVEDFQVKVATSATANQLKNKYSSNNPCSSTPMPGTPSVPVKVFSTCDECNEIATEILKEFDDECTNPNNPLNQMLQNLNDEFKGMIDPVLLDHYSTAAQQYLTNHPKYVQCMSENCYEGERADSFNPNESICEECTGLEGQELMDCIVGCIPEGIDGCPECIKPEWIKLDSDGIPLLDIESKMVFIDEAAFRNCVEICNNPEVSDVCVGCEEYIDENGNAIEPMYSFCATVKCGMSQSATDICPDCADYLETEQVNGFYQKKPIYVSYNVITESGIQQRYKYAYDVCFEQHCEFNTYDNECADISRPNELIKVDWKCDNCNEELKYVTRAEDCLYQSLLPIAQEQNCPECVDYEALGFESFAECYLCKCATVECEESIIFKSPDCWDKALEYGLQSDEFLDCVAENFDPTTDCPACEDTKAVFGEDSDEYRRCVSFNAKDSQIQGDPNACKDLSTDCIKASLAHNIGRCHELYFKVLKGESCRVEGSNPADCCFLETMEYIDKSIYTATKSVSNQKSVSTQMGIPESLNLQKIDVLMKQGISTISYDKIEGEGDEIYSVDTFGVTGSDGTPYTVTRKRAVTISDEVVESYLGVIVMGLSEEEKAELIAQTKEKISRLMITVSDKEGDIVKVYDSDYDKMCEISRNFKELFIDELVTTVEDVVIEYVKEKDISKIEANIDDCLINKVLAEDMKIRKKVQSLGLSDEEAKDYIKFEILAKIDAVDLVDYFANECIIYDVSVMEYLTKKKSLADLDPDSVIYSVGAAVSVKDRDIANVPYTIKKDDVGEITLSEDQFKVIVDTKVIFPKMEPPIEVIQRHLDHLKEIHYLNSAEYLNSINVKITIPEKLVQSYDMNEFKRIIVPNLESLISVRFFEDSNIKVTLEVDVDTFEWSVLGMEDKAKLLVTVDVDDDKFASIRDMLADVEDEEMKVKILRFIESLEKLDNLKLLEVPVDTRIYKDVEEGVLIIDIK